MEEAKPLYEESLQLRTVVYGERSIKVAESKQNLATILDSQGKWLMQISPPLAVNSHTLLYTLLSLPLTTTYQHAPTPSNTFPRVGHLQEAETLLLDALSIYEDVLGRQSPEVQQTHSPIHPPPAPARQLSPPTTTITSLSPTPTYSPPYHTLSPCVMIVLGCGDEEQPGGAADPSGQTGRG